MTGILKGMDSFFIRVKACLGLRMAASGYELFFHQGLLFASIISCSTLAISSIS